MFKQGLGLLKKNETWETLYATYEVGHKRKFILEIKKAGYDQKWQYPLETKSLSTRAAMKFLKQNDISPSSAGKEVTAPYQKMTPIMVLAKVVPESWTDRIVPGWATRIKTKSVRSWEDGSVGTQFLACN